MSCSCGLVYNLVSNKSGYAPVPLTGVAVEVQIVDLVAQVAVTQSYVNKESNPIEAVYLFPLDEGAGVCEFSAEIEGKQIVGVVKERKEAKRDYEEAIKTGHSAFLLKEKEPDIFKAKIGNLAPGSGARVKLTYITELKVEPDGDIRFFLPTTIAPRYVPAGDATSVAKDLASITYTSECNYQLEFNAWVTMGSTIKEIQSPTHRLSVKIQPELPSQGKVTLEDAITKMDCDLVLLIKVNDPNKPRLICQKSENGTSALMLSIVPSFKLKDQKTELIFLIDRSGSMDGQGIQQAKQALTLFLHSLPADCYFNIIGFGSTFEKLFGESTKYDGESLARAKSHADRLVANLGGTEIMKPLKMILKQPHIEGYLRQIFVLTDGEVSNTDQVISLIRKESGKARVFALGLGSSASHHLIEGMARAGNGTALFASFHERLEKKVLQQLQDALQPSLTDVEVKWDGYDEKGVEKGEETSVPIQTNRTLMGYGKPLKPSEADELATQPAKLSQAPDIGSIPPIFDGRHAVVYALLGVDGHTPKWAEMTASSPDGPLSLRVDLCPNNLENGLLIQRLAAKKLIQLLQDTVTRSSSESNENLKKEVISLGCQYGLATRYTSYVAVDARENKELKDSWMTLKSRDVPLDIADGWGRVLLYGGGGARCTGGGGGRGPRGPGRGGGGRKQVDSASCFTDGMRRSPRNHPYSRKTANSTKALVSPSVIGFDIKKANDNDKLMHLISTQRFDGSFELGRELAELLESTVDQLKERGNQIHVDDDVWATVLAVVYLNNALTSLRNSWLLVANKAEKWMTFKGVSAAIQEEALKFVKEKLNI